MLFGEGGDKVGCDGGGCDCVDGSGSGGGVWREPPQTLLPPITLPTPQIPPPNLQSGKLFRVPTANIVTTTTALCQHHHQYPTITIITTTTIIPPVPKPPSLTPRIHISMSLLLLLYLQSLHQLSPPPFIKGWA